MSNTSPNCVCGSATELKITNVYAPPGRDRYYRCLSGQLCFSEDLAWVYDAGWKAIKTPAELTRLNSHVSNNRSRLEAWWASLRPMPTESTNIAILEEFSIDLISDDWNV